MPDLPPTPEPRELLNRLGVGVIVIVILAGVYLLMSDELERLHAIIMKLLEGGG